METTAKNTEDGIDVCRVCELIDNNLTKKPVLYCSICDAKMCDDCRSDVPKRARAAVKEFFLKKFKR